MEWPPRILSLSSPNHDGLRPATVGLIIHSTRYGKLRTLEAEYRGTVSYMMQTGSNTAHAVVGPDEVALVVAVELAAWHAEELNRTHLGIEVAQSVPTQAFTEFQYHATAWLTAQWCERFGIPVVRGMNSMTPGIVAHGDTEQGRRKGKSDPGSLWDWGRFMGLVATGGHPEVTLMDREKGLEAMAALRRWYAVQSPAAMEIVHLKDVHGSDAARRVADGAGHALAALRILEDALGEARTA